MLASNGPSLALGPVELERGGEGGLIGPPSKLSQKRAETGITGVPLPTKKIGPSDIPVVCMQRIIELLLAVLQSLCFKRAVAFDLSSVDFMLDLSDQ